MGNGIRYYIGDGLVIYLLGFNGLLWEESELRIDGILEFTVEGIQDTHMTPITSATKATRLLR